MIVTSKDGTAERMLSLIRGRVTGATPLYMNDYFVLFLVCLINCLCCNLPYKIKLFAFTIRSSRLNLIFPMWHISSNRAVTLMIWLPPSNFDPKALIFNERGYSSLFCKNVFSAHLGGLSNHSNSGGITLTHQETDQNDPETLHENQLPNKTSKNSKLILIVDSCGVDNNNYIHDQSLKLQNVVEYGKLAKLEII